MTAPRFTPGETWRLVEVPKWPFRLRIESSDGREVIQAGRSCYSTRHKTLDDLREMRDWGEGRSDALAANARQLADLRMCAASPALYAALSKCERAGVRDSLDACPICFVYSGDDHLTSCELAAALAAARGGQ